MFRQLLLGVSLLLVACQGCGSQPKPVSSSSSSVPSEAGATPQNSIPTASVVVLTPEELATSFNLGQEFGGKTIQVTDRVDSFMTNTSDKWCYVLRKAPNEPPLNMCVAADAEPWASAVPGQTVTLRCEVPKGQDHPVVGWKISSTDSNPVPIISSKKFAEAFTADGKAAHDKYTKKFLYVTGTVTETEVGKNAFDEPLYYFYLEGTDSLRVQVGFKVESKEVAEKIMAGQTLTAMCSYNENGFSLDLQDKAITLWGRPVTVPFPVDGVTYAKEE